MLNLHGITIKLEEKYQIGTDGTNRPEYVSQFTDVENVLVGSPKEEEILETLDLTGKRAVYVLGIPKGDAHDWKNKKVILWGQQFRTIGEPVRGIEDMCPLAWNQNVKVELIE